MAADLSLKNNKIASFLEGKTNVFPTPEFMYVHSYRPHPNFLSEIEIMIRKADLHLQKNPRKAGVIAKLESLARRFAETLGDMTEDRARELLLLIREIYQICKNLPLEER